MKSTIYKYLFIFLFIAGIVSCSKTDDNTAGPTGDNRDKLVGNWTTDEKSKVGGPSTYTIAISKDVNSSDGIIMKNFYQLGSNTNTLASLDGNAITIPQQSVSGYTIKGSGTYNSNGSINFVFTSNDGQKIDSVTAINHH